MIANIKYPLTYIGVVAFITFVIFLFNFVGWYELSWKLSDWLKPIVLLPILVSLVSTNLPEFISNKVRLRLKWLHTRLGINQFYHFIAFQAAVLLLIALAKSMVGDNFYLNAVDIATSIASSLVLLLYVYYLLRILRNN